MDKAKNFVPGSKIMGKVGDAAKKGSNKLKAKAAEAAARSKGVDPKTAKLMAQELERQMNEKDAIKKEQKERKTREAYASDSAIKSGKFYSKDKDTKAADKEFDKRVKTAVKEGGKYATRRKKTSKGKK